MSEKLTDDERALRDSIRQLAAKVGYVAARKYEGPEIYSEAEDLRCARQYWQFYSGLPGSIRGHSIVSHLARWAGVDQLSFGQIVTAYRGFLDGWVLRGREHRACQQ